MSYEITKKCLMFLSIHTILYMLVNIRYITLDSFLSKYKINFKFKKMNIFLLRHMHRKK